MNNIISQSIKRTCKSKKDGFDSFDTRAVARCKRRSPSNNAMEIEQEKSNLHHII